MKTLIQGKAKFVLKAILFFMVFVGLLFVFTSSLGLLPKHLIFNNFEGTYKGIIGVLAGLIITKIFLLYDKKQFADIGLTWGPGTLINFIKGAVIGIVLMGLTAGAVIYFTHSNIAVNQDGQVLYFLLASIPIFFSALMEEIAFRAYPLQTLNNNVGMRTAIFTTSILFAISHILYGWTIAASFGPAIWGLFFGLAAIYSKGIAMPTGIHYAVNLTTTAIGAKGNAISIWTIEPANTSPSNQYGIDWVIVIPHIIL